VYDVSAIGALHYNHMIPCGSPTGPGCPTHRVSQPSNPKAVGVDVRARGSDALAGRAAPDAPLPRERPWRQTRRSCRTWRV